MYTIYVYNIQKKTSVDKNKTSYLKILLKVDVGTGSA